MVCRGGPWKIPWYAVEDAVDGFAAGGATACHGMSRKGQQCLSPRSGAEMVGLPLNPDVIVLKPKDSGQTNCDLLPDYQALRSCFRRARSRTVLSVFLHCASEGSSTPAVRAA